MERNNDHNGNVIEFPGAEEKVRKEIGTEKFAKISSLRGSALGVCHFTDDKVYGIDTNLNDEEETVRHYTMTLVFPNYFRFGTNVAKMMSDMYRIADEVMTTATAGQIRITFTIKDIYQE